MTAEIRNTRAGESHNKGLAWKPETIAAYERMKSYRDQSVVWVIPTRRMLDISVAMSWFNIDWPMNAARTHPISAVGLEVADAYNRLFRLAIDEEYCAIENGDKSYAEFVAKMQFILTTEDDNLIPPNAVTGLFSSIYACPDCGGDIDPEAWACADGHHGFDAVGGLYWTKSLPPRPMAYGDPKLTEDFRPVSVAEAIKKGSTIEVNGIAMGCTLWRKETFRHVSAPWFSTEKGITQDLYFCRKAKAEIGARFGVNCGVQVGHIDTRTGMRF